MTWKKPKGQNSWVAWCGKKPYVHGIACLCWVLPSQIILRNVESYPWSNMGSNSWSFLKRNLLCQCSIFRLQKNGGISWIIFFLWWQGHVTIQFIWGEVFNSCFHVPVLGMLDMLDPSSGNWTPELNLELLAATKSSPWASTRHVYIRSFWQPHHDHQWSTCRCYLHWWKCWELNEPGEKTGWATVVDKDVEDFPGNTKWKLSIYQVIQAVTFWSLS